jgi:predicted GNAT family N-acyltransferase
VGADADTFLVEPLTPQHHRDQFDCGVEALNRYLRTQARQEMDRDVAVAYVLCPTRRPSSIAGYYTLSSTAVRLADVPETTRKRLPRYPLVPATLLGRLAVDQTDRGHGLGERLLIDALQRSLIASRSVASVAVIVDAKDSSGATFYARYGFIAFPDEPLRLFLPMKTIAALEAKRVR